jgi:nucleoside-triphosphatase THEP1
MKIFLTGEPGVGKSTLIAAVVESIDKKQGFFTKEARVARGGAAPKNL